jgi:hypothetical protein
MISQYDQMGYAQYKPLSIEEIWAPGREMRAKHDKLEEEYAQQELLGGAASLGLQKGVDDVAIATNQAYMGAIKSAADELATKGFNDAGRRRQLLALKNQYTQNVLPIQNALKHREDAIKMHNERLAKDQTYRSTFDPSKVAVTDYLNNNQAFTSKGVSGQAVYTDAAQAISNLKNVAATELPALKRSGLIDQYFTLMNNGLRPEQAADLMKKNSKSQAEAESWTPMAKMTVAAIDGAMQRHGVFDVFKDRPDIIDEFWQNTSKAAIFGIGESKIGTMKDDWNMKMREMANENPPDDGLMDEERYNPDYDKREIQELSSIRESAKGRTVISDEEAIESMKISRSLAKKYPNIKEYQIPDNMTPAQYRAKIGQVTKEQAISKIIQLGRELGIWQKNSKNFDEYADKVIEAQKEKFKTSNKVKTISKVDNDIVGGILNSVLIRSDGDLLDVNGRSFRVDNNSSASKSVDFDFKKGMYLSLPGDDGKIHSVPFNIADLNIKALTDDYNLIAAIESGKYKYSDIKIGDNEYMDKKTYEAFKNQTAKAIRNRLSLKPEATAVKPKL